MTYDNDGRHNVKRRLTARSALALLLLSGIASSQDADNETLIAVSYTHLRAHET